MMSFTLENGQMREIFRSGGCSTLSVPLSHRITSVPSIEKNIAQIIVEHMDRHKIVYRIGAITLTLLLGMGVGEAMAATTTSTGIDVGAERLYMKLVRIGKWVIIIKGAFDTITATVQGDFITARKSALSYLLVYVILLGLPWAFNQVESLFEGM